MSCVIPCKLRMSIASLNRNCFVSFSVLCFLTCHPFHACPNPFNIASTSYEFSLIIILAGCMVSHTSGLHGFLLPPGTHSDINFFAQRACAAFVICLSVCRIIYHAPHRSKVFFQDRCESMARRVLQRIDRTR